MPVAPEPLPSGEEELLLLHNPRCSKSRRVKALLQERGLAFAERRYLEEPLDAEELAELEQRLGQPLRTWVRRREAVFAEAGLHERSGEAELRSAVARHPILMERPVLVRGMRARIGRPPERVLELL